GKPAGHQWAVLMATSGKKHWPPMGRTQWPLTLDRLDFIRRGQAAGLTLAQIGQVLDIRDRGQAPCRHVTDLLDTRLDVIDRQLAELAQLRTTIADLREDAAAGDPATCSPEDVCRYL
ncbi:MerR family DNA-binding protein, partial [Micrococcus luteus]